MYYTRKNDNYNYTQNLLKVSGVKTDKILNIVYCKIANFKYILKYKVRFSIIIIIFFWQIYR
jgi:hypothetical protein